MPGSKGIDFYWSEPCDILGAERSTLIKLHLKYGKSSFYCQGPTSYTASLWEITLYQPDLPGSTMEPCRKFYHLKAQDFNWEFEVNNLALVCQAGDAVGKLKYQVQLTG